MTADDDDFDLEVIELEPVDPPSSTRQDTRIATGVRRRRGPALLGVVVIIALVGSAILSQSDDSSRGSTSTTRVGQADIALDKSPLFPFRVGAQVLTGGSAGLQLIDTDTGRRTVPRIAGLPPGPVTIVARSGATVAVRVETQLYWFTFTERSAHAVEATGAFPDLRRGYLWLADSDSARLVPGGSQPIAADGLAIGATSKGGLLVTTDDGVLLQSARPDAEPGGTVAYAPATVIAVHPDRIAWAANDCGVLRCPVHITEIETGATSTWTGATSTWLQLVVRPSPLVVSGSSGVFSPDGNYLAIVVPDSSVTSAERIIVTDLRSRATTVRAVRGRVEEPGRPARVDATGYTIDWTLDSRFLLFAPPSGSGPIRIMDAATGEIESSRAPIGLITSIAVVGTSTTGPLDLPRRGTRASIDTSGPTLFGEFSLVGVDEHQVDVADTSTGKVTIYPVGGAPPAATPGVIAKVTAGWLVVRSNRGGVFVVLVPDDGGEPSSVGPGNEVYASGDGRHAWIVNEGFVRRYDPTTGTLDDPVEFSGPLAAVNGGLVAASASETQTQTRLDILDPLGTVRRGAAMIDGSSIFIVAAGGTKIAFRDEDGLHVLDLETGSDRVVTPLRVLSVALSPNGENLAWIYDDIGPPLGGTVRAMRLRDATVQLLGEDAHRVLVADDGTVIFTAGNDLYRGWVDENGSNRVYGYAPDSGALLALS